MKIYTVTVERLMVDDKVYSTDTYSIMAHDEEEARQIVYNNLNLNFEPKFRIAGVELNEH